MGFGGGLRAGCRKNTALQCGTKKSNSRLCATEREALEMLELSEVIDCGCRIEGA